MNASPGLPSAYLRERWLGRFPELPGVGDELVSRYADPVRAYHDVRHLSEVLGGVDLLRAESADPGTVELAAWFHDAVYDVGRADNEEASAALAKTRLSPYLDVAVVDEVVRLVLLTRDHAVADGDPNGAVLCDADLAVLAGSPPDYDDYTRRVRREYALVPDEAFRAGRAAVLRSLLDLPRLFRTDHGRKHWEGPARANLHRELTALLP